ncbi:hypothetical protein BKA93DRAFT_776434 [Sparassis latifolia]
MSIVLRIAVRCRIYPADSKGRYDGQTVLNWHSSHAVETGDYVVLSPDRQPVKVGRTPERHRPRILSSDLTKTTGEPTLFCHWRECRRRILHPFYGDPRLPVAHQDVVSTPSWPQCSRADTLT